VRRREGGREGEVIPRVWENTVATEGMLGNLNPLGDGPGRSLANHGARVPEVLPAAELEGFLTGLIIAMPREPVLGAAVGDDVEEAQELAVKAPAGGDDARQEGVLESGISGPVAVHLGASGALEDPAGLRVAEGSISAHVSQMISAEFVVDCDVDDQVSAATEVDVLEHQVAPTHLALRFVMEGMLRRSVVILDLFVVALSLLGASLRRPCPCPAHSLELSGAPTSPGSLRAGGESSVRAVSTYFRHIESGSERERRLFLERTKAKKTAWISSSFWQYALETRWLGERERELAGCAERLWNRAIFVETAGLFWKKLAGWVLT